MLEPPRAVTVKPDRVMAEGQRLMAVDHDSPSTMPMSHQPLAMAASVKDLMWKSVGLFRDRQGLSSAVGTLEAVAVPGSPASADEWRVRNLVTVARLIARAALRREESRGGHFRADFPDRDDARWRVHLVETKPIE